MTNLSVIKDGVYKHYKGYLYRVIDIATNTETLEDMVVYYALYDDHKIWVRPLGMFLEEIEMNNKKIPRFEYLPEENEQNNSG